MSETPKKTTNKAAATGSKPAEVTPKKAIKSKAATPAKKITPKAKTAPVEPVVETTPTLEVTAEKAPSLWARIKKTLGF